MRVYQENKKNVNGTVQIINGDALYEKARSGLLELSMLLGIGFMLMMFEEDVMNYAAPKVSIILLQIALVTVMALKRLP